MSVVLSEYLPLLSTAPHGIQKLRGLIFELAIRGKLVPQNPNDDPASELLKRIAQERTKLETACKIKKAKPLPQLEVNELSYKAPVGWSLCRFSEFALDISTGPFGSMLHQSDYVKGGIPLVNPSHMVNGRIVPESDVAVSEEKAIELSNYRLAVGDIVMARRGEVGRTAVVTEREKGWLCGTGSFVIHLDEETSRSFIVMLFRSASVRRYLGDEAVGTTMVNLNHGILKNMPVALPPVAEQHRIVAKVDELMALCDRLEEEQTDAEVAHAKLVDALLGTLTQSTDTADLASNWQSLLEHFDTLFATERSLNALKQTILQLAVMGKLVAQDPNDEPARELLKRIEHERTRLEAEGMCKPSKPIPPVEEDERPFEVPKGWEWERIGNYVFQTDYGLSEKTFELNDGIPVLKMGDIQGGDVILGGQKTVPLTTEGLPYLFLEPDDLLYNRTNSAELVGKTGIFRGQPQRFSFASYLIRIRCAKEMVSPAFMNLAMNAPMFRETEIVPHLKQQCGQANVNGTILRNMRIPIPPAAEQHRIVAKVEELMALCDRLKVDLAESCRRQERLASTLIESTLKAA